MADFFLLAAWLPAVLGLWAIVDTIRHTPFSNAMFYAQSVLEAVLVGLLVASIVALSQGPHHVDSWLFFSYWVVTLLVPPAAVLWGIGDKSRWGSGVVVIGMWTVTVLLVRLAQIWVS